MPGQRDFEVGGARFGGSGTGCRRTASNLCGCDRGPPLRGPASGLRRVGAATGIAPAFRREAEAFLTHSRTRPCVFGEQAAPPSRSGCAAASGSISPPWTECASGWRTTPTPHAGRRWPARWRRGLRHTRRDDHEERQEPASERAPGRDLAGGVRAQALVGAVWSRNDRASGAICAAIGTSQGIFSDYAAARHGCGADGKRNSTLASASGAMAGQVPVNVNYAWKAIRASSFLSGDTQLAEFAMAVTGTRTRPGWRRSWNASFRACCASRA